MAKRPEIDLGLAIAGALLPPGERRTLDELAAFAGCHRNMIWLIENKALMKLRKKLGLRQYKALREELRQVLETTSF